MYEKFGESDYVLSNREKAMRAKRSRHYCVACDRALVGQVGKCPVCGNRANRKKRKGYNYTMCSGHEPNHDYRTCRKSDCLECQELVDYGIVMACDECDRLGDQDADGWELMPDGRVLCLSCALRQGNMKIEVEREETENMCQLCIPPSLDEIKAKVDMIIANEIKLVADYKADKDTYSTIYSTIFGCCMKAFRGSANPKVVRPIVEEKLSTFRPLVNDRAEL